MSAVPDLRSLDLSILDGRVRIRKTQELGRVVRRQECGGMIYIEVITDQHERRWPLCLLDVEAAA